MGRAARVASQSAKRAGHAAILIFFVTFLAFPFYWMLITTFKRTASACSLARRAASTS